jgi:hypothetical protein
MLYKYREKYLKRLFPEEIVENIMIKLIPKCYDLYNLLKISRKYDVTNPIEDYNHYVTTYKFDIEDCSIQRCKICNKIIFMIISGNKKMKTIDFKLCRH